MTQNVTKSTPTFTLGFMRLTPQPNYRALHVQPLTKTQGFMRFTLNHLYGFCMAHPKPSSWVLCGSRGFYVAHPKPSSWVFIWHTPGKSFCLQTLGVFISADLRWETHIKYIISKAVSRLYFLKQLKRAGLSSSHLLHFYTTVIRLVLEYASPLWHPTLTKSQIERLEAVQRRAIKIIFCYSSPPRILLL